MKSLKILVVEHNLEYLARIRDILTRIKHFQTKISYTMRLDTTLQCLDREFYDVILLDLFLPDSEGFKTVAQIHCITHIPIIVLSDSEDKGFILEAMRHGARDYLIKPKLNLDILTESIRRVIAQSSVNKGISENISDFRSEEDFEVTHEMTKYSTIDMSKRSARAQDKDMESTHTMPRYSTMDMSKRSTKAQDKDMEGTHTMPRYSTMDMSRRSARTQDDGASRHSTADVSKRPKTQNVHLESTLDGSSRHSTADVSKRPKTQNVHLESTPDGSSRHSTADISKRPRNQDADQQLYLSSDPDFGTSQDLTQYSSLLQEDGQHGLNQAISSAKEKSKRTDVNSLVLEPLEKFESSDKIGVIFHSLDEILKKIVLSLQDILPQLKLPAYFEKAMHLLDYELITTKEEKTEETEDKLYRVIFEILGAELSNAISQNDILQISFYEAWGKISTNPFYKDILASKPPCRVFFVFFRFLFFLFHYISKETDKNTEIKLARNILQILETVSVPSPIVQDKACKLLMIFQWCLRNPLKKSLLCPCQEMAR